ncbi:MAG: TIGR03960 family B12-binding radical SAM protein [Provencibacterium sp.]|jgi:radical SAM family uncharacterized protein|nr:TIGR03960 family B12-binding radical SAM protein [Provencibacterium sp.]
MNNQEKIEYALRRVQKPARYTGGELNSIKKDIARDGIRQRIAFCFPDLYEVGMSHLGMKILYSLYNEQPDVWCERVFMPDSDMCGQMQAFSLPLFALESGDPIGEFDFVAFTLQYEMSYTTILTMLKMGNIPLRSAARDERYPLVIAGGPCACNPEPIADFIDLFLLGEGEQLNLELCALYRETGRNRREFLRRAAQIPGVYVPSFYTISYQEDGIIRSITPQEGVPQRIEKRIVRDLDKVFFPQKFVVPFIGAVHDRAMLEVLRGCIRGCRFCQAGFIYRPLREKHADTLDRDAHALCESTGFEEISLTSLSTSDLTELEPLMDRLLGWTEKEKVNLSLPSLRIDNFSPSLVEKIARVRKSGLTFAPEAGTQRLRDVINKNITEEEIFSSCRAAFEGGYTAVKLYFMIGLPTETEEDLRGIIDLAQRIVDLFYQLPGKPKGKGVSVTVSVSSFVPKPFTPFQFEPQDTVEALRQKQEFLRGLIHSRKISLKWHNADVSHVEGILARGDRRLSAVLESLCNKGVYLESWEERFHPELWEACMQEQGLSAAFYANRRREYGETLPWGMLDYGVTPEFLVRENRLAHEARTTPHCRQQCAGCGANRLLGRACF